MKQPEFFDVEVNGGPLRVARWGKGPRTVVAVHGITASCMSWAMIASVLSDEVTLITPDLRGRGGSSALAGPWGMAVHADDVAAVVEAVGGGPTVVAGHSMGGYVAVVLAARRPELVGQLVLVDGGLPFPIALDGIDPDAALEATLGPALARLSQTFPSWDAYRDFWKVHPSFVGEWNEAVEEYARYDLVGDPPDMRSRVSAVAVRDDGRDMLVNIAQIQDALRALRCPTHLFWAPRNIMNEPSPIQPAELIDHWKSVLANLTAEEVPDTNHYVIAMGERGARIIAARLEAAVMASAAP